MSLTRYASNNLNFNTVQKLAESSELRNKHNNHIILESGSEDETIQQNNNSNYNPTIEIIKKRPFSKTLTQSQCKYYIIKIVTKIMKELESIITNAMEIIKEHKTT